MRPAAALVAALLLAGPAQAEQALPPHGEWAVSRDLRTAWAVWARGDLERAEQIAAAALERHVSDAIDDRARRMLCGLQVARQAWSDGMEACAGWAQAEPDDPEAQLLLGRVLLEQGAADPARKAYRKAEQLAPVDARAPLGLALIAWRLDRDPDAFAAALRRADALGQPLAALPRQDGWQQLADDEAFLGVLAAVLAD